MIWYDTNCAYIEAFLHLERRACLRGRALRYLYLWARLNTKAKRMNVECVMDFECQYEDLKGTNCLQLNV